MKSGGWIMLLVGVVMRKSEGFVAPGSVGMQRMRTKNQERSTVQGMVPASMLEPQMLLAAVEEEAKTGAFDSAVKLIEQSIIGIHDQLGAGSYGVAIIIFTLIVKLFTFPLNKAQIESTTKMQALQPAVKRIQATYANDPQQMNIMMAELYSENDLNPLAGCLPALVQIPIFIALYRSLLNLAKADLLEESFLWLPNLEGPVFGAQNADWLFKFDNWNGASPPLGWHDTLAYLSLPAILVIAQSISTKLLQPPADPNNPNDQSNNPVLKFLPFMVGFFSLNVPCSLCLYWIINNIVTTGTTLFIKQSLVSGDGAVTMGGAPVAEPPTPKAPRPQQNPSSFNDLLQANKPSRISTDTVIDATKDAVVVAEQELEEHTPTTTAATTPSEPPSKSAAKKKSKAKSRRTKKSRR